jgi:hypothetical protein
VTTQSSASLLSTRGNFIACRVLTMICHTCNAATRHRHQNDACLQHIRPYTHAHAIPDRRECCQRSIRLRNATIEPQ